MLDSHWPVTRLYGCLLALGLVVQWGCEHGEAHHHRRPTDINEYLARLDRPERDDYQKPQEVVDALALQPGMAVADLGSGSGYFTRRFVDAVTGTGTVYAIDVEPEMLAYVKHSVEAMPRPSRIEYILANEADPKLPQQSVDLIFVCNTYHHLENRTSYFARLKPALKPGGRIAVVDFYADERSGPIGFLAGISCPERP